MLLIIGGATGTGKSKAAMEIAKRLDGEIVSCDSMQIYRYMDIGTAKVTPEEMTVIPHHMIDIVNPEDEFSVAEYQILAEKAINDIICRGKTPILVGGTGLYINSIIYPFGFSQAEKDENLRRDLKNQLDTFGNEYLFDKLKGIDRMASEKLHPNDTKRVIRAIEIKLLTGKSITEANEKKASRPYKMYTIDFDRERLYKKINDRVDLMFEQGLLSEVECLLKRQGLSFNSQSMQAIGYKEFKAYFEGESALESVKEEIKKNTRNYAKRQLTWFRGYSDCKYVDFMNAIDEITKDYQNK